MGDKFIDITSEIQIPSNELEFSFARSSGPGGQNVNKTNSQAILKWNIQETQSIEASLKLQIMAKLKNRINKAGELVIQSDLYRDQILNTEDCIEKFKQLILTASYIPKKRVPTKPSRGSKERRLGAKKIQSDKKKNRRVDYD